MMKYFLPLLICMAALPLSAGTLFYKTAEGEIKSISRVTLQSIDSKKVIIKASRGTEVLSLSNLVKYYNSDLKNNEFDDNSGDYTIRIGNVNAPKRTERKRKDSVETMEFKVPYYVSLKPNSRNTGNIRQPYFYLFVLIGGGNGNRRVYSFCYPERAKTQVIPYNEVKMLEKVLDFDRPNINMNDRRIGVPRSNNGLAGSDGAAVFKLSGIKNGKIIAWHLIGWGKNDIELSYGETVDTSYRVSQNWWVR